MSQVTPDIPAAIAEEPAAVSQAPVAQGSPVGRPQLPVRPMSVGVDLGASVSSLSTAPANSSPLQQANSSPGSEPEVRTSTDVRTSVDGGEGAEEPEEGEEVKPKKYVPNAAMNALVGLLRSSVGTSSWKSNTFLKQAMAMKSGVGGSPSALQKRRSAGNSLRAAAPVDVVVPDSVESLEGSAELQRAPSAKSAASVGPEGSTGAVNEPVQEQGSPAIVAAAPPVATDSSLSLTDAGLAKAATDEPSPESSTPEITPAELVPEAASEEPAPEEPAARKPKMYGARPDPMVAAISGELKKRGAPPVPVPAAEEEAGEELSHGAEVEGESLDSVASAPAVMAAPAEIKVGYSMSCLLFVTSSQSFLQPATLPRPKVPPRIPPKTNTDTPPQPSPSADTPEASASVGSVSSEAAPAEPAQESRGSLEKRPTASAHDVSWDGAPVPLVITKKTAIDTSNDEVVEEVSWSIRKA